MKGRPRSRAVRSRIILAFHMALIYHTQDFRVYEETRDQPMPGPFSAPPIFWGKSPGDEFASYGGIVVKWSVRETRISEMRGLIPRFDHQLDLIFS